MRFERNRRPEPAHARATLSFSEADKPYQVWMLLIWVAALLIALTPPQHVHGRLIASLQPPLP
jgi:hypothetical protein